MPGDQPKDDGRCSGDGFSQDRSFDFNDLRTRFVSLAASAKQGSTQRLQAESCYPRSPRNHEPWRTRRSWLAGKKQKQEQLRIPPRRCVVIASSFALSVV